ncbi:3-phosphoshikimate 1-carboxyvinyltransferase [PVC group bacterium (ex Bugula neritina AB1)]|nr:3-phosphoshikimate 1-carboxyvinyltransferase [PVC group bacterium (ex Bugula neritina AB1)]
MKILPAESPLRGSFSIPGDKSISHRGVILGSLANGTTELSGFLQSEDCLHTRECFSQMGIESHLDDKGTLMIHGKGLLGLTKPKERLYVGNSGTAIRLLSGVLAAQPFSSSIEGDESIAQRPMKRVIDPLQSMGAKIESQGGLAPLIFQPSELKGIDYKMPVASAQVKSCLLLASLYSKGQTHIHEPHPSRDHTEKMFKKFGIDILSSEQGVIFSSQKQNLREISGQKLDIPGDISSAAFFIVAALLTPNSSLTLKNIGINKTRRGIVDVLLKMGANIKITEKEGAFEPVADLTVEYSELKPIDIQGSVIANLIDEIPILAVALSHAKGTSHIRDARELRVKESDRIKSIVQMLQGIGGQVEEYEDGMCITGGKPLRGGQVKTFMDHRIAMSSAVAALTSSEGVQIDDIACIKTSFPSFFDIYNQIQERA